MIALWKVLVEMKFGGFVLAFCFAWSFERGQYDFMSIDNGVFDLGLRSVVVSPLRLQELTLRDVRLNIVTWQYLAMRIRSLWLGFFFWGWKPHVMIIIRSQLGSIMLEDSDFCNASAGHEDQHVDGTSNAKTIMD